MNRLTWEEKYNLLKEYLDENNGVYPKYNEIYRNINIGSWINTQRNVYSNGVKADDGSLRYKTNSLTKKQIEKLNEINFLWKSSSHGNKWLKNFKLLEEYLKENNGEYPTATEIYKGIKLGQWVVKQRAIYNNGEKLDDVTIIYNGHKLIKWQIEKLNEINFMWITQDNSWEEKCNLLEEYLEEHDGEYPISSEYYKGVALGQWISTQRTIYSNGEKKEDGSIKHKGSVLTKERIEKLNEINFLWQSNIHDNEWLRNFELLEEYLKEHNGEYPKCNEIYRNINIGTWMSTQRNVYNNGEKIDDVTIVYNGNKLTKERIEKLNEINFMWSGQKDEWTEKYNLLKVYLEEHNGKYPKYNEIYRNINIGSWVTIQRTTYNNGKKEEDGTIRYNSNSLTKEKIEKLNEIGFIWVPYLKKDYNTNINSEKVRRTINKKILYKLEKVLLESKKEIESKEDIEKIEEEFIKSLTMFN